MKTNMNQLKELRQKTGVGFSDCKSALVEANGDIEKAIVILKEKGMLKLSKKSSRDAFEGQIHIIINDDKTRCTLVEINCETDFVSRTPEFSKGSYEIAQQIHQHQVQSIDEEIPAVIKEKIQALVQKLGENIVIRHIESVSEHADCYPATYIHQGNQLAVVVWISAENKDLYLEDSFQQFGKDLAMHITAMNPSYVSKEKVAQDWLDEQRSIFTKQIENDNKPSYIKERIVEGKLNQLLNEIILLEQPFAKDPGKKVQKWIQKHETMWNTHIQVHRFIRRKVGKKSM